MWISIIADLEAHGLKLKDISARAEIPLSTLSELKTGTTTNPRWETGIKLQKLRAEIFGEAPQRGRKPTHAKPLRVEAAKRQATSKAARAA